LAAYEFTVNGPTVLNATGQTFGGAFNGTPLDESPEEGGAPLAAAGGAGGGDEPPQDPHEILANLVAKYRDAFAASSLLAAGFLSVSEQTSGPAFNAANFGKALERAVAADVEANYSNILRHVSEPGKEGPDFVGVGAASGRTFDITTYLSQEAHYARPYGENLELILYDRPPLWP
jgi:hypothetical protein